MSNHFLIELQSYGWCLMTGKYETVSAKNEDIKAIWVITIRLPTAITDTFTTIVREKISKIFCHYLLLL